MPYYYALSILLSAFLLFLVEPMIGKFILPWFGGTPTVWSTVLLFFQVVLTGGYAYAYWLLGRSRNRLQGIVHLVLLSLSLGLLLVTALAWPSPLTPDANWRLHGSDLPVLGILRILAVSVGFPYFLLSSNSTLVQAWLWSAGYVLFVISAAYLALRTYRRVPVADTQESRSSQPAEEKRPGIGMHFLWIGLAACASTLLISVTSQITQEVAVIPFLWVVPLALYLLSFVLAFSRGHWYSRYLYLWEVYRLADEFGLGTALIEDKGDGIRSYDSIWMLLTRNEGFLQLPTVTARSAQRPSIPASLRLWTDDFSNLVQALK